MFKLSGSILLLGAAIAWSAPAAATVTIVAASSGQGTLVHGTGVEQTGLTVQGNLGAGGPTIVNFTGDTTQSASTSDPLHIQGGQGQADVEGAEINIAAPHNDFYNMLSGNIFLTGNQAIDYIEFGLTSSGSGTVDFIITGSDGTTSFLNQIMGNGDTFFAFNTTGNSTITNVQFVADAPMQLTLLKQVRIDTTIGAVPEPATWAMMLVGFGAMGVSLRRRRRGNGLPQAA